ncbi:MAG: catalytic domain of component of various dehydrogenase complexe [Jatrophihabitantaceae bacterium]|nr:catalytic domain of component of various dehydrogenase complexe [Jatrophihabitantaceae bacterium]
MATERFLLPDVGEGLTEADILQWHVAPGDTVEVNQIIVEIETAKAAVELPAPFAGVVGALLVSVGQTVPVGAPIIEIETVSLDALPSDSAPAMLVGYGPRDTSLHRRRRVAPKPVLTVVPAGPAPVLAKPPVRKLAKALGVDLVDVAGSGPGGVVTRLDVEAAATSSGVSAPSGAPSAVEERVPVRGLVRHMAAAMSLSVATIPQVTVLLTIDMSATMELRERVNARPEFADARTSPLSFVARAALLALRRHPLLNSVWCDDPQEIVLRPAVNLGIAAATERGLIVPNIKDAAQLSLLELSTALRALAATARAGRSTPADLRDGTFTISNIGVFGVDAGTPIITPGESAILAFGAVRRQPWVITASDGSEAIEPRWVTQLSLSFDHRHIDGQAGSRFLADIGAILTDPALALL